MLKENKDWFKSTTTSWSRWGIPISVQLSVIKHESSFNRLADAKSSSAYGYSQALTGTFNEYKKATNNRTAKRDSFHDSTDFIGWYFNNTIEKLQHNPHDASTFYLAYHEGIGDYKKNLI